MGGLDTVGLGDTIALAGTGLATIIGRATTIALATLEINKTQKIKNFFIYIFLTDKTNID
jgi:hypothetical protein